MADDMSGVATATVYTPLIPGFEVSKETDLYVTYAALFIMALIPILIGSHRSIDVLCTRPGQKNTTEAMTHRDALMFPLVASAFLFGLYMVFNIFGKEYVNSLLTLYFLFWGVIAITRTIRPIIERPLPSVLTKHPFYLNFAQASESVESTNGLDGKKTSENTKTDEPLLMLEFDWIDVICMVISLIIGGFYLYSKHWILNNIFGLSFSVNAIEMLSIGSFRIGSLLLSGLFIYDIFWVFGTDVMVNVAKSFEGPIKLVFPRHLLSQGWGADQFAMLGLGDIVLPGVFIALLLRFDWSRRNTDGTFSRRYFLTAFVSYILGLGTTFAVMHIFNAPQPALLYLVPCCILIPLVFSFIRGESEKLFLYTEGDDNDIKDSENVTKNDKKKIDKVSSKKSVVEPSTTSTYKTRSKSPRRRKDE